MADLDTRGKRESGFGICLSFTRVLPTPDGSNADSESERGHLVFNYVLGEVAEAESLIVGAIFSNSPGLVR